MHFKLHILGFIVFTGFLTWVLTLSDAFEWVYQFSRSHEDWELDEYIIAVVAALIVFVLTAANLLRLNYKERIKALKRVQEIEMKNIENQNVQALGTLSGGIAHSLNNLLTPIIGLTQLTKDALPEKSKERANLDEVLGAAIEGRNLIKDILKFSRHDSLNRKLFSLNDICSEISTLARASVPTKIKLDWVLCTDQCDIWADETQVKSIILNVISNAVDAIGDGYGEIHVKLERCNIGETEIDANDDLKKGPYAVLSIIDTGMGIEDDAKERLFDPFFTTKEPGRGTGLGLSTAWNTMQELGGSIIVTSTPGAGSAFDIYFPLISKESA